MKNLLNLLTSKGPFFFINPTSSIKGLRVNKLSKVFLVKGH